MDFVSSKSAVVFWCAVLIVGQEKASNCKIANETRTNDKNGYHDTVHPAASRTKKKWNLRNITRQSGQLGRRDLSLHTIFPWISSGVVLDLSRMIVPLRWIALTVAVGVGAVATPLLPLA
uniref:Secreted protein n=1 Tax=Anopheles farauti TaxID=69004 RepID=A0A182QSN9_9DIPT